MEAFSIYLPFVIKLPLVLVWIVGIILAMRIKNQNMRVAKLVSSSLILAVLGTVVSFIAHTNILAQYSLGNITVETLTTSNIIIQISEVTILVIVFILLLLAVFKPHSSKKPLKKDNVRSYKANSLKK